MAEKPQDTDWEIPRQHSGAQHRDSVELPLLSLLGLVEPIQGCAEVTLSLLVPLTKPCPGPHCIEKGNEEVLGELQEGQIHLQKSDLSLGTAE